MFSAGSHCPGVPHPGRSRPSGKCWLTDPSPQVGAASERSAKVGLPARTRTLTCGFARRRAIWYTTGRKIGQGPRTRTGPHPASDAGGALSPHVPENVGRPTGARKLAWFSKIGPDVRNRTSYPLRAAGLQSASDPTRKRREDPMVGQAFGVTASAVLRSTPASGGWSARRESNPHFPRRDPRRRATTALR